MRPSKFQQRMLLKKIKMEYSIQIWVLEFMLINVQFSLSFNSHCSKTRWNETFKTFLLFKFIKMSFNWRNVKEFFKNWGRHKNLKLCVRNAIDFRIERAPKNFSIISAPRTYLPIVNNPKWPEIATQTEIGLLGNSIFLFHFGGDFDAES